MKLWYDSKKLMFTWKYTEKGRLPGRWITDFIISLKYLA